MWTIFSPPRRTSYLHTVRCPYYIQWYSEDAERWNTLICELAHCWVWLDEPTTCKSPAAQLRTHLLTHDATILHLPAVGACQHLFGDILRIPGRKARSNPRWFCFRIALPSGTPFL